MKHYDHHSWFRRLLVSVTYSVIRFLGSWIAKYSQRQTCKVCGRYDKFNFTLPDDIWAAIVPPEYQNRVVCLTCVDDFAARERIDYAQHLAGHPLTFSGDQASFEFKSNQD